MHSEIQKEFLKEHWLGPSWERQTERHWGWS
jgi:hypothetical protein